MLSINTNLSSLIAQNSLKMSTLKLNQAVERMSTGYKINGAKDNAANYSIATNMTTKIGAYQVAEDNCAMGLDMLTTANESLNLISDKLSRLRALAEQAANGTYGAQSLKAINSEANALVDEIERIYSTAEYNGIKLFNEDSSAPQEPVWRDTTGMIDFSDVMYDSSINSGTYVISTAAELEELANLQEQGAIDEQFEFILGCDIDMNDIDYFEGIGTEDNPFYASFDGNGYVISNLNLDTATIASLFPYLGGTVSNLGLENVHLIGVNYAGGIAGILNGSVTNCYVTGIVGARGTYGAISAINEGSAEITHCYHDTNAPFYGLSSKTFIPCEPFTFEPHDIIPDIDMDLPITNIALQVGANAGTSSIIDVDTIFNLNVSELRQIGQDVSYLNIIDGFIQQVSAKQTEFGAAQNRLESALDEISTHYENLVSSRSTLKDADIAKVSSEYIKQQILQQASSTLLSTANQTPALALQLL